LRLTGIGTQSPPTWQAAEKEPNKKPDGFAADMDDDDEKVGDMEEDEDEEKAADEDEEKADDGKEEFLEMINKKKKKKTGDSSSRTYAITLPNGVQARATQEVIEFMAANDKKEALPTVDHMEVARVTAKAVQVLGADFDIASCDSIDSVKKAIIGKALPAVDCKTLSGDSLAVMYGAAVKTYDSKGAQFTQDTSFLTGKTADGKTVDGAAAQNPFSEMLSLSSTSHAVADSAPGVISKSRKLKFVGETKGDK